MKKIDNGGYLLPESSVLDLVTAASEVNGFKKADEIVQKVVNEVNGNCAEMLPDVVDAFQNVYKLYSPFLNDEGKSLLLSYVTLLRYELEVAAGGYQGTFTLPDEVIDRLPEGLYLEVAMGPGDNIAKMYNRKERSTFFGNDISCGMVERARATLGDKARVQRLDAASLSRTYPINSFDVVAILNALDRIPDARGALVQASSLLRPGGFLVVGNCIPLQNEKEIGGVNVVYVPEGKRIESMEEALGVAGCSLEDSLQKIPWPIETIADGEEKLDVDVAVGRKPK